MTAHRPRLDVEHELWEKAQTEARALLSRLDRGETTAPETVIRHLRIFTGRDDGRR